GGGGGGRAFGDRGSTGIVRMEWAELRASHAAHAGRPRQTHDSRHEEHATMKWCRFQSGHTAAYGIIESDTVTEITGTPFGSHTRTSVTHSVGAVKLLVPVIPPTFYPAAVNYRH